MNPFDPTNLVSLRGLGTMRGFTAALPTDTVRKLLPHGLELGAQSVTPPGTHPVLFGFNDMFRLHWSFPSLLPNETYRELSVGVPFAYLTRGQVTSQSPGPYYFMPQLYLDNLFAIVGGTLFWGFNKQLASFQVTADRYAVSATGSGDSFTSLAWTNVGEHRPLHEFPHFDPVRQMLSQPVISMVPAAIGPFFVLSDFNKMWDRGVIRPVHAAMTVDVEYMVGFPGGRYPADTLSPGIDESVLGAYDLRVPWLLSLPYPPPMFG